MNTQKENTKINHTETGCSHYSGATATRTENKKVYNKAYVCSNAHMHQSLH